MLAISLIDSNGLVTGSRDGTAVRWARGDTGLSQEVVYEGHTQWVTATCLDGSGSLFTGSTDTTVRRWDLATGRVLAIYKPGRSKFDEVTSLCVAGGYLYAGSREA